jgi:hypothetical protein
MAPRGSLPAAGARVTTTVSDLGLPGLPSGGPDYTPGRRGLGLAGEGEQVGDGAMAFDGVAQRQIGVDLITVTASLAVAGDGAGLLEVLDDVLDGAFGDADAGGDVAEAGIRVFGEADENVGVVGKEGPLTAGRYGCGR